MSCVPNISSFSALSFLLLPIQYSLTFICYGFLDSITFQDELDRLKPKLDKVFKENKDLVQEMKDRLENQLGTDIDGEGDFEPVTDQEQVISNLQMQVESALQVFNRALTTFKLEGEVTSLSESSQGEVERLLGEVNCD